jgi:hypothetical protein
MNNSNEVRKGITQARFNEDASNMLFGEIFLVSIVCGFYWSSWWVFGLISIGLVISLMIKPLAIILAILLSIGWAIIGYGIGVFFDSSSGSIVLAILGLLAGLGAHISALTWVEDINT